LDDITLTPLPLPVFQSLATSGSSLQLTWVSMPGLTYQVQYKTNLLQSDWINLGQPVVATGYSSLLLDTNALSSSSRRFYRLMIAL